MLLQNLKAPKEEEGNVCICKCVWVCVDVSVNMHIQGEKLSKKIPEYLPPDYKQRRCQDLWINYSQWIILTVKSHTGISRKTFSSVYVNKCKENKTKQKQPRKFEDKRLEIIRLKMLVRHFASTDFDICIWGSDPQTMHAMPPPTLQITL